VGSQSRPACVGVAREAARACAALLQRTPRKSAAAPVLPARCETAAAAWRRCGRRPASASAAGAAARTRASAPCWARQRRRASRAALRSSVRRSRRDARGRSRTPTRHTEKQQRRRARQATCSPHAVLPRGRTKDTRSGLPCRPDAVRHASPGCARATAPPGAPADRARSGAARAPQSMVCCRLTQRQWLLRERSPMRLRAGATRRG
jgi:hypothetical protein